MMKNKIIKGLSIVLALSILLTTWLCVLSVSAADEKDYAILVDNSAGTGYGQLYLHEVGMPSLSMPAGNYTVQFDFYTLEAGDTNFPI
jgi:hypothetical protein